MGSKRYSSEEIYSKLRGRILTDRYYPGQKLSENSLAEELGCSRTPIREILKKLESDGLVVVRPKSGSYVRNENEKDVIELLQVRTYLESLAFALCLDRMTDREIGRIERLKSQMDASVSVHPMDMMKYASLHYEFHYSIVKGSKNDLLTRTFERLNLRYSHMFYRWMDDTAACETQSEHTQIVRFLRNRDPEGEGFMKEHLWSLLKRLIRAKR